MPYYFSLITLPMSITIVVMISMNCNCSCLEWWIQSSCEFHLCSQVNTERALWPQSSCPCHPPILIQGYHWLITHIEGLILANVQGGLNVWKRFGTFTQVRRKTTGKGSWKFNFKVIVQTLKTK